MIIMEWTRGPTLIFVIGLRWAIGIPARGGHTFDTLSLEGEGGGEGGNLLIPLHLTFSP